MGHRIETGVRADDQLRGDRGIHARQQLAAPLRLRQHLGVQGDPRFVGGRLVEGLTGAVQGERALARMS
ncbi:hypothetical protein ACFSNO_19780, partial [Streptomyces cirratus]